MLQTQFDKITTRETIYKYACNLWSAVWGFQDVLKQHEIRRNKGKKDKEPEKEETENTTKTATILWRFSLAILHYKTGKF